MDAEPSQWESIFRRDGRVFPQPRPQVVRFADDLRAAGLTTVLDLGCGTGRHLVHMAQKGLRVCGMDNAPTALRLTRQWLNSETLRADLLLADILHPLPFASDSFDALLSTQVIHHGRLAQVAAIADEIRRVVRTGGRILLSVRTRDAQAGSVPDHVEIEPHTFVPTSGPEQGLPHHLFTPEEFRGLFPRFDVTALQVFDETVLLLEAVKQN